ncbi:MAG TPA: membrane protein insertion efficiency factor YidD [Candidatus Sumerlaeota bacterium]|nr:membrane protein insertion efficiency factor YidD [Candidatus Sumerlaeota bacterium]
MIILMDRLLRRILYKLVRGYQRFVSPFLPPACRFVPTCSNYAAEVLQRKPLFPGLWLIIRRLLKCHPFHPGGFDPVP